MRTWLSGSGLIGGALMLYACGIDVAVPKEEQLAVISGPSTTVNIHTRHSPPYQLVLGIPANHAATVSSPEFEGELSVAEGPREVARFPIATSASQECNWLQGHGAVQCLIVTWNVQVNGEPFASYLRQGTDYTIHLTFSKVPPPGTALWLASISRKRD